MKRKPWRKIKSPTGNYIIIRRICYGILIMELAFLVQKSGIPALAIGEWQEEIQIELEDGPMAAQRTEPGLQEWIYGVRVRIKDGVLEFYKKRNQKEEVKNTH